MTHWTEPNHFPPFPKKGINSSSSSASPFLSTQSLVCNIFVRIFGNVQEIHSRFLHPLIPVVVCVLDSKKDIWALVNFFLYKKKRIPAILFLRPFIDHRNRLFYKKFEFPFVFCKSPARILGNRRYNFFLFCNVCGNIAQWQHGVKGFRPELQLSSSRIFFIHGIFIGKIAILSVFFSGGGNILPRNGNLIFSQGWRREDRFIGR